MARSSALAGAAPHGLWGVWRRQWFLIVLGLVLAIGFGLPGGLSSANDRALWEGRINLFPRNWLVAAVSFLMALALDTSAIWAAIRRPVAVMLATACNAVAAPLLAWGIAMFFHGDLKVGMLIVGATPCTVASAAVWTRRAGGNDSAAMLVTLTTNLLCFVVMPFWLWLAADKSVGISPGQMSWQLFLSVVVPTLLAQLLRVIPTVKSQANRYRSQLSLSAQVGVLGMVLLGAFTAGFRMAGSSGGLPIRTWLVLIAAVVVMHMLILVFGLFLAKLARLGPGDQIAVAISGSQKTQLVGLQAAAQLNVGLAMLAMVAYHVCQLVADTLVADAWRKRHPLLSEDALSKTA